MVIEVAVGVLVAWFARKAGKVGKRLDGLTDEVIDASAAKLHDLVMAKLGGDQAVAKLAAEAASTGEASARTQDRVRLALEDAVEEDPAFASALRAAVPALSTGTQGVAIGGNVAADRGGVAIGGITGGSVTVHPHQPDRS